MNFQLQNKIAVISGGSVGIGLAVAYVPNSPWIMNQVDPYQMNNLVGSANHTGLQEKLECVLQAKLRQTNDTFHPKQHYLKE